MHFFIQVSKDSQFFTVDDNFDHAIIPVDRFSDFQTIPLSEVIRQSLYHFNRQNIFDADTLTVFEDTYWFADAICEGGYSYLFACYRYFDSSFEVIEFANSLVSDPLIQFYLHLKLVDIVSRFSPGSSYSISALEVKEIVDDFVKLYNLEH